MCCDIDEACGNVSAAILSMENCLTFARDDNPNYEHDRADYWKNGATVRFQAAADEALTRKNRSPDYHIPPALREHYKRMVEKRAG
jgi:hypothetical protein